MPESVEELRALVQMARLQALCLLARVNIAEADADRLAASYRRLSPVLEPHVHVLRLHDEAVAQRKQP